MLKSKLVADYDLKTETRKEDPSKIDNKITPKQSPKSLTTNYAKKRTAVPYTDAKTRKPQRGQSALESISNTLRWSFGSLFGSDQE